MEPVFGQGAGGSAPTLCGRILRVRAGAARYGKAWPKREESNAFDVYALSRYSRRLYGGAAVGHTIPPRSDRMNSGSVRLGVNRAGWGAKRCH